MRYNFTMNTKRRRSSKAAKSLKLQEKPQTISFSAWFYRKCEENPSLKQWQDIEILTFFKKNGLTENEELDTYEKQFKLF